MFGWLKPKPAKYLYKITYCLNALIDVDIKVVTFNLSNMKTKIVAAEDAMQAQVEFAKTTTLHPHVYIHRIEKDENPTRVE